MSNPQNSKLDYWIKQSEMLQSAIARMTNNSLEIKKVGLTVWAAIVGFGFTNHNAALFVLAFVAFVLFTDCTDASLAIQVGRSRQSDQNYATGLGAWRPILLPSLS